VSGNESDTSPGRSDSGQGGTGPGATGHDIIRPPGTAQPTTAQPGTAQPGRWEARITFLRSRAAVARAEVSAIEAMHINPDDLEELLANASPDDVAMAEAVEHRISERVTAARQVADAAEADYERAVLDGAELDDSPQSGTGPEAAAPRPGVDTD